MDIYVDINHGYATKTLLHMSFIKKHRDIESEH